MSRGENTRLLSENDQDHPQYYHTSHSQGFDVQFAETHSVNISPHVVLTDGVPAGYHESAGYHDSLEYATDDLSSSITAHQYLEDAELFVVSQVISQEAFRTTPARWYILFAFCYMGLTQGFIGNAWVPIATVLEHEFGWNDRRTSLLAMWMSVMFVPGAFLFPWVMSWTNMRTVIIGNTTLMALAGLLKILSVTVIPLDYLIYSAHVTQIVNGFCGAVPFSGVMYITVNWFPTKERIVATGVVMASLNTGIAIPFLLGPTLVPWTECNSTPNATVTTVLEDACHKHEFYCHRLMYYLVIQGAFMMLTVVLVVIYFPSRPKYAPTASAVTARLDIIQGLIILMRRWNFWLIVFAYALTSGVFNGYGLVLDVILEKSKISQTTAGYIGFTALLASVPANIFIGFLGAIFSRFQKALNIGILTLGTLCMCTFVAQLEWWIPRSMPLVWVTCILGVMCITGVVPIMFDMSTESSHPVSEELSTTIMVLGNQLMCCFFTVILQIPHLIKDDQKDRLNYVLIGSFAVSVCLASLYRTTNVRLLIDAHSITIDQLDTRSIQQIRNAGVRLNR